MRSSTSTSPGGCGGLSSSVMSAPAMKVRLAAVSTIARMLASSRARVKASLSPARTACLRALTGGVSTIVAATPLGRSSTMLDNAFFLPPVGYLTFAGASLRSSATDISVSSNPAFVRAASGAPDELLLFLHRFLQGPGHRRDVEDRRLLDRHGIRR